MAGKQRTANARVFPRRGHAGAEAEVRRKNTVFSRFFVSLNLGLLLLLLVWITVGYFIYRYR